MRANHTTMSMLPNTIIPRNGIVAKPKMSIGESVQAGIKPP
jgi:hypothetical protein